MFAIDLRAAVEAAPRTGLVELSAALWKAFAANAVTEAEAEELSTLIEARKVVERSAQICAVSEPAGRVPEFRDPGASANLQTLGPGDQGANLRFDPEAGSKPKSGLCSPHRLRPPVRSAAVERRRRWAAAGRMPPSIAAHFTTGEQAALAVVAVEVTKRNACSMAIGAVAALAGVSESTVKRALRHARAIGLLLIKERRLSRYRNDTNVVTVISREWLTWLELRRSGGGVQSRPGTNTRGFRDGAIGVDQPRARAAADSHKRPYGTGRPSIMERSEGFGRSRAGRR